MPIIRQCVIKRGNTESDKPKVQSVKHRVRMEVNKLQQIPQKAGFTPPIKRRSLMFNIQHASFSQESKQSPKRTLIIRQVMQHRIARNQIKLVRLESSVLQRRVDDKKFLSLKRSFVPLPQNRAHLSR